MTEDSSKLIKKYMNVLKEAIPTTQEIEQGILVNKTPNNLQNSLSAILAEKTGNNPTSVKIVLTKLIKDLPITQDERKIIKQIILLLLRQNPNTIRNMR